MVARNFSLEDLPYKRLLQIPDEEREFLNLEELKPLQLTELGLPSHQTDDKVHRSCVKQLPSNIDSSDNNSPNSNSHLLQYQVNEIAYSQSLHSHHDESQSHNHVQHNQHYFDLNGHLTNDNCNSNPQFLAQKGMTHTSHNDDTVQSNPSAVPMSHKQDQEYKDRSHNNHKHSSDDQKCDPHSPCYNGSSRKRKSFYAEASDFEDNTEDDSKSVRTTDDSKKQNHSEIEKRRRDKMNTYITELSAMVPMCHAMSRKLDKLTVLRMAVQHLKTIRGAVHSYTEGHYKPAFLSEQELKMLILQAAEGFLFVVGCDRGRILYVSESVSKILNYSQADLLGQSWFDILHPKDVAKVKEQLSSSDLSPRERLIDAKTMLPVKTDMPHGMSRLCPGARRSFFCRMKCKTTAQIKEESSEMSTRRKKPVNSDKKYSVIQCTGYLKSWAPAKVGLDEQETDLDGESCNLTCLVAIGRTAPNIYNSNQHPQFLNYPKLRSIQFISRHAIDGKFLFVDQRATLVLGFLPQELLGTSMYEYYHHEDVPALAESHKLALQGPEKITTSIYRFRTKENGLVRLQSDWKSFRNPWTKEVEYLIAKNSVILNDIKDDNNFKLDGANNVPGNFEFFNQTTNGREMHRMINSHVEASKIGRQIAEQVLDYHRRQDSSSDSSSDTDLCIPSSNSNMLSSGDNSISAGEMPNSRLVVSSHQRVNGSITGISQVRSNINGSPDPGSDSEIVRLMGNSAIPEQPNETVAADGNDETAMAVIMSLLEADAGLGGPVDFSGLPWPLP